MTGQRVLAVLAALLARVTAVTPAPTPGVVAVVALVVAVAVAVRPVWRRIRHAVTIVHEAGHGFVAALSGRRLAGIRLHSDTSGVTVSAGPRRGPGMVATLLAGYPAPSAAGVLVAWAVGAGHAAAALWGALALLLLVLVQIRNWFGLWSIAVSAAVVGAATWLLDPWWRTLTAVALAALLLLGGLRGALELPAARRRDRGRTSDADQLAVATHVPAPVWLGVFPLLALVAAAASALLLGLVPRP